MNWLLFASIQYVEIYWSAAWTTTWESICYHRGLLPTTLVSFKDSLASSFMCNIMWECENVRIAEFLFQQKQLENLVLSIRQTSHQKTSFNELMKLHFILSSPSHGVSTFAGYPLKCTCRKMVQNMMWNLQICCKKKKGGKIEEEKKGLAYDYIYLTTSLKVYKCIWLKKKKLLRDIFSYVSIVIN